MTLDEWHVRPSGAGVAAMVAGSLMEAYFPAAAAGFVVGFAVKLGAGIAAAGATWVVLWVILGVRAVRARSWRDGIHALVVRNRWWTYRVPLASIQEVRTGRIGFGANPAGVIVRATDHGRNPWHRIRGLPIDGTASYSADRTNADVAAVRRMIAAARRRANVEQPQHDMLADALAPFDRPHTIRPPSTVVEHGGEACRVGGEPSRIQHRLIRSHRLDRHRTLVRVHPDDDVQIDCHAPPTSPVRGVVADKAGGHRFYQQSIPFSSLSRPTAAGAAHAK